MLLRRRKVAAGAVEGMLADVEIALLERLAAAVRPPACVVEVGSFRGRSTAALAAGVRGAGARLYAIEPHEAFEGVLGGAFGPQDRVAFFRNMLRAGVVEEVRLVNLSSEVVAPGWTQPVGLLWLDGDHRYEGVARDWRAWRPHLTEDAAVALHDSDAPGVHRLVAELPGEGWQVVETVAVTTVLRRSVDSR